MKLTKRQTGTLAIPLFLAVAKFVSFLGLCYQESIEPPKSVIEKIFYSGIFPNHANDNAFRGKQITFSDIKIDLALQDDKKNIIFAVSDSNSYGTTTYINPADADKGYALVALSYSLVKAAPNTSGSPHAFYSEYRGGASLDVYRDRIKDQIAGTMTFGDQTREFSEMSEKEVAALRSGLMNGTIPCFAIRTLTPQVNPTKSAPGGLNP